MSHCKAGSLLGNGPLVDPDMVYTEVRIDSRMRTKFIRKTIFTDGCLSTGWQFCQREQAMAAYPPVVTGPASRVELRISCKGLIRADLLSKSDPRVIVQTADQRGAWTEVAKLSSYALSCLLQT